MLRQSIILSDPPLYQLPADISATVWISNYIIIQCIFVYTGAYTINACIWTPEKATLEYDKLLRIMYLYDPKACGYNLKTSASIINVQLSNETYGLNVRPIKWMPADMTVATRLSAKTRRYINLSVFAHVIWMVVALALRIFKTTKKTRLLKIFFTVFFYTTLSIIIFDIFMAIVYVAHIQKSLTKGMILRYTGWAVEMKISGYDDFGGWFPLIAVFCWLRGIIFFGLNIYCCRVIQLAKRRLEKTEVRKKLLWHENKPIPDPDFRRPINEDVLYFKKGEYKPMKKKYTTYFYNNNTL